MRRRNFKADKMLKLDEIEGERTRRRNLPRKARKIAEEKKNKGRKKSKRINDSGRKLRSSIESVSHKVELQKEEMPLIDLLYLAKKKNSGVSRIKIEPSVSNENDYILMPPLETLEDAEVKMEKLFEQHKISKNQKNGRWKHSYNKMVYLRKCAANSDQPTQDQDETSQSTSFEEHERIPKIEDISYENSESIKRDKKWTKKVNPLSLHYTEKKRPYLKCPACGATSFSPNMYHEHLLSHLHKTENNYMCNFCNYSNVELGMLFAHLTKHQNQCETCNENLLRKDNYKKHCQHCPTNVFECGVKRDHHGMFACTICELVFDLLAQLEKHWFKHTCTKPKSYQCNECTGMYENMETLKNHTCLKCPVCGEVYESLHRLKIHTNWAKHNLKCEICSYEFILSVDHEKHMSLHRKVYQPMKDYMHCLRAADHKTFQCNLCDKIFYALSALRRHLTEEHNVVSAKVKEILIVESESYYDNDVNSLQQEIDPLQQDTDPLQQDIDPLQQDTDPLQQDIDPLQ